MRALPAPPERFVLRFKRMEWTLSWDDWGRGFHFLRIVAWGMCLMRGSRVGRLCACACARACAC
jgi:hypothetical protein